MSPLDPAQDSAEPSEEALAPRFTCRYCGHAHRAVALAPGEKALCVQCGLVLIKGTRIGPDVTIALIATGLVLAVPALALPFVTVAKLGNERVGHLLSGATALWAEHMHLLSIWVLFCAAFLPLLLLGSLAALTVPERFGWVWPWTRHLRRFAIALEEWAMPEVYVLSILVALTKLGTLVDVTIGPGFWCYAAMSFLLLLSWRNVHLGLAGKAPRRAPAPAPVVGAAPSAPSSPPSAA